MAQVLKHSYEAMPEPNMVVAMGSCAISSGIFSTSPECRSGVDAILPVDAYIPGRPPRAARLIPALRSWLQD